MAGNLPSTTRASLGTEVRQSARVSCRVYFLAANAITPRVRPRIYGRLGGHARLGQPQIDGWQPSKYNKGFTTDGGATVGACFMSGLFPRCECDYSTRARVSTALERPSAARAAPNRWLATFQVQQGLHYGRRCDSRRVFHVGSISSLRMRLPHACARVSTALERPSAARAAPN